LLTVTRGTNSSTSLMEDYIDVFELPEVAFAAMEDMVNVRIINITGKTIYQKENIEVNGNFSTMIDLTGNSNGIYYIYVDGDKSSYFRKIVLQR